MCLPTKCILQVFHSGVNSISWFLHHQSELFLFAAVYIPLPGIPTITAYRRVRFKIP